MLNTTRADKIVLGSSAVKLMQRKGKCKRSLENRMLFMVLMRIRLSLLLKEFRFKILSGRLSRIF